MAARRAVLAGVADQAVQQCPRRADGGAGDRRERAERSCRWWRTTPKATPIEAAILGLGLCGDRVAGFQHLLGRIPSLRAVSSQTPLAVQLPFLLWAAMRFGPTGTGLSLLTTSVLSSWAVVHGVGPFAIARAADHHHRRHAVADRRGDDADVACDLARRAASDAAGAAPPLAIRRSPLAAVVGARTAPEQPDVARLRRVARPDWRRARRGLADAVRQRRTRETISNRSTAWTDPRMDGIPEAAIVDQLLWAQHSLQVEGDTMLRLATTRTSTEIPHGGLVRVRRPVRPFRSSARAGARGADVRLGRRAAAGRTICSRQRAPGWRGAGGRAETQALGGVRCARARS